MGSYDFQYGCSSSGLLEETVQGLADDRRIFACLAVPLCNGGIGRFSATHWNDRDKGLRLAGYQIGRLVGRLAEAERLRPSCRIRGYTRQRPVDMVHSGYMGGALDRCYVNRACIVSAGWCA